MFPRTPLVSKVPYTLCVPEQPRRTPQIRGRVARSITDLLKHQASDDEDLQASLAISEIAPHLEPVWDQAHEYMLKSSLSYFFAEMIRGPEEKPYYGKSLVGRHHVEWDDIVNQCDRFLIEAARDHGKCKPAGSLVIHAEGHRIPIEKWCGGQVIGFDSSTYELKPSSSTPSMCIGKKPCLRVQTRTGRTEVVASDHRFATIDGWIHARDLEVGQRIACPKTLPVNGRHHLRSGEAWLLGMLVGDGGITGPVVLTNSDSLIVDAASAVCARLGWELTDVGGSGRAYGINNDNKRNSGARPWLRSHGLLGCNSHTKRVPEAIYTAPNSDVADFIAGWFDADGTVNFNGGGAVELYSVSEDLISDALHLLTRLGVIAVKSPKKGSYEGREHWSWRLTIRGSSIHRFFSKVKLRSEKGALLERLDMLQQEKREGGSIDLLPSGVVAWLEHGKDWTRRRGGPTFENCYDMTRSKAASIAKLQGNERLAKLAAAEILWDEIVDVQSVGDLDVYAISVEGTESYVGEDIISHNSHYFSLAYPIWRAGWTHPGKLGYIFSATQSLAKAFLALVKEELLSNPKFTHLLPLSRDKSWTQHEIVLRNGSEIRARGMGVKVRGGHPYWIMVDDGLTDESIYSETIRRRITDYFLSAVMNMIVPGGQIGVVGTPMHAADLYYHLKSTGEWHCRSYPAIDKKGRILFPERYNRERLEKRKRELKSLARFAREFLCRPLSDEASIFPMALFEGSDIRLPYRLGLPAAYWHERGMQTFTGVDFAMSSSAEADYTVIITLAKDEHGNRWLANIRRGQGWGFQKQLDAIKEENVLMQPEIIHAEANQMQRIFTDEIVRTTDIPIRKFYTAGVQPAKPWKRGMASITMGKHHLERGVPSMRMSLENRKWRIPRGDEQSIELTDTWMGEFNAMSWQDGKCISVADHDDLVMATWMADTAARMGGFKFSFGETETGADKEPPHGAPEAPRIAASATPEVKENLASTPPGLYRSGQAQEQDSQSWKPTEGAPRVSDLGFGGADPFGAAGGFGF